MDKQSGAFNPYRDASIHGTQPEPIAAANDRQGFNDAVRHFDAVNGFRFPKTIADIPKSLRVVVRFIALLWVGGFAYVLLHTLINTIIMMTR